MSIYIYICKRERERDRERDRQRDRERETDRETERQRERPRRRVGMGSPLHFATKQERHSLPPTYRRAAAPQVLRSKRNVLLRATFTRAMTHDLKLRAEVGRGRVAARIRLSPVRHSESDCRGLGGVRVLAGRGRGREQQARCRRAAHRVAVQPIARRGDARDANVISTVMSLTRKPHLAGWCGGSGSFRRGEARLREGRGRE